MESTVDQQKCPSDDDIMMEESFRSMPMSSSGLDVPEDLADATAAIIHAATHNFRSDSYLSEDEEEDESRVFAEELAVVEEYADTSMDSAGMDLGEQGAFVAPDDVVSQRRRTSTMSSDFNAEIATAPLPTTTEGILQSCGACLLSVQELSDLWIRSEGDLVSALHKTRAGFSMPDLTKFPFTVRRSSTRPDADILLLHSVFATFCTPAPSLKEVGAIFQQEQTEFQKHGGKLVEMRRQSPESPSPNDNSLPWDPLISVSIKQKAPVVRLLKHNPDKHLLRLPVPFQLAFFRILIRLLTNESDEQYNEECLFTCKWLQEEDAEAVRRQSLRDSLLKRSNSKDEPRMSVTEFKNKTHDRVQRLRKRRQSVQKQRKDQSWIVERMNKTSSQKAASRRLSQVYTIVRFRAAWADDAVAAVLNLMEVILDGHSHLVGPVTRLLGLLCTAGVSVQGLRRMLALSEGPVLHGSEALAERLLLVRALSTAAEGASQSTLLVGKASPRHFFCFGRSSGLTRTIKSLPSWPFRNDFGMAVWFRPESFDAVEEDQYPILLSLRAPDGGGLEISLVPLDPNDKSKATVIAVTTYDSGYKETREEGQVNRVLLKGCVLLPRVWYHLAVRHTRFRLKGVFSLSARQQVTIMLDGKVMLTEPLKFPNVSFVENDPATNPSNLLSALRKNYSTSMNVQFGANFEGQTGALYVFNDNVSDATLRALYEVTAGTNRLKRKDSIVDNRWQSQSKQTTSVVEIEAADADEIVVSNKEGRSSSFLGSTKVNVVDLGEGPESEGDVPVELSKVNLGAKLFLVWDPKRVEGNYALDLQSGAHVAMDLDNVIPWSVNGARDVIASIGGVQALLPVCRTLLAASSDKPLSAANADDKIRGTDERREVGDAMIPSLIALLAAFLRDHDENAREMLRCGGIDLVEQFLMTDKVSKPMEKSMMGALRTSRKISEILLDALLDLKFACARYDVLETLVFTRLMFNLSLWFGGGHRTPGVALYPTLLPVLASLASSNPEKVRDCIGVQQMLELVKELTDVGNSPEEASKYSKEPATELFDRGKLSDLFVDSPLTVHERRHVVDIIFGMIANVMVVGATAAEMTPLINFISDNSEYEWEQASLQASRGIDPNLRAGSRKERHLSNLRASSVLFYLFHHRPSPPSLMLNFDSCCGGRQGAVSWILCCLVNSFDDEMRSMGIGCLADYLDVALPNGEKMLLEKGRPEAAPQVSTLSTSRVGNTAKRLSMSITSMGKGLAAIGSGQVLSSILPPTKPVGVDIVYKLLWHLLKCHRSRVGKRTHASLVYFLVEDRAVDFDCRARITEFVVSDEVLHSGSKLSLSLADALLLEAQSVRGKRLHKREALNTILRLLRFLPNVWKEKWLHVIVELVTSNSANIGAVVACPEWQSSLFHVISDTLEEFSAKYGDNGKPTKVKELPSKEDADGDRLGSLTPGSPSSIREVRSGEVGDERGTPHRIRDDPTRVEARFNLSLKLYAMLLAHSFRQSGEKATEQVASLERVCANGHNVLCLILNHLLAELMERGTVEITSVPANVSRETNWLLKESAKVVTNGILASNSKALDSTTAVKHWHSLRYSAGVIAAAVTQSGFGMGDLFDYRSLPSAASDPVSGGLYGIRLSDANVVGMSAGEYEKTMALGVSAKEREDHEFHRQICVMLAAQTLSLLDAFIFPDSLDASLPASQLHGLALVRGSEGRLGISQGPILASLIRLSLVLLCNLEPSSVKFLQCCSRLRCFLHWSLELIRESVALAGYSAAFHDLTAPLDRLVLAIVLQCHRGLARCSAVLAEMESQSCAQYFPDQQAKHKNHKRLLRVSFELREIVLGAYRGRNEVLRAALSHKAFESLQSALEKTASNDFEGKRRPSTKEVIVRAFLDTEWVKGFHDIDIREGLSIPDQVSNGQRHFHKTSSHRGSLAIEELSTESKAILKDFSKALNTAFEEYCEDQRRWAETDAVRDLEFEGDAVIKRLAARFRSESTEWIRAMAIRSQSAIGRWKAVERNVAELWTSDSAHWKFARHTDRLSRRILLVRNRAFNDHESASYELMLGLEREKAMKEREKLQRKREKELSEVLKRNSALITASKDDNEDLEEHEEPIDDEDENPTIPEPPAHLRAESSGFFDGVALHDIPESAEATLDDDDFEKVEDVDAWAKVFIWTDTESVVARFEGVNVVTLRTITEGRVLLTTHGLYFNQTGDVINVMTKEKGFTNESDSLFEHRDLRWRLSRLTEVHGRRFMLRAQAIELFFSDSYELFLNFTGGTRERDRFYAKLRNSCKVPLLWSPKSLKPRAVFKKSKLTSLWRRGKISNFHYLMQLNKMAGRTFNDITQYPVLPWVLSDYTSESIDLSDPDVYRDLSKPVGALNPERLEGLLQRYRDLASFGFTENERFLYGSHYSSPGVVLHYLLRQEPFTSMAIELQSGRFDCPDRLFFDVASCWKSCLTSTSDVKELIPEMFSCPEIFLNTNAFPLGRTQEDRSISNVGLPPWAKGSAHEFVRIQRLALESEHVSKNLHHWIDLIFGFKQRGPEAELAHNVFHYLSYEGTVDIDKITDEVERQAAESHIQNFGQTPSQLLVKEPHPARASEETRWRPLMYHEMVARRMRCHTPPKQLGLKRTKGAVLNMHVTSEAVLTFYGDGSVASYKFVAARGSRPFSFKLDKHRQLARNDLSTSRSAIKRGSAAPQSMETNPSHLAVGPWSFAVTLGGEAKENLRRKAVTTRLAPYQESLREAEASGLMVSCGYWDDTVKVHSMDGSRILCSHNGGHRGPIRCLSIGSCGALMVTGGQDATCRVWVVDHADMAVALSDGYVQTALGESNDGDQRLTCCHVLWGHDSPIAAVDLCSDLDVVVSGSLTGMVCVHSVRRGRFVRSFRPRKPGHKRSKASAVRKIALDSSGIFVVHLEDGSLHSYTINGAHLCSVGAQEKLNDMRLTSNGEMLITGGEKCQVVVRTVRDLRICSMLDIARHGPIRCIRLTPDDLNPIPQYLFIGSDDGMVTIVDEDRILTRRKLSTGSVSD